MWTDRYDITEGSTDANAGDFAARNVCGDPKYGENKFSVPFDIAVPHTAKTLKFEVGSTLPEKKGQGADQVASWALSNLNIYVR